MKRMISAFLLFAFLCACVPTPEQDAVKQKNSGLL